jgi:hypothetical protein
VAVAPLAADTDGIQTVLKYASPDTIVGVLATVGAAWALSTARRSATALEVCLIVSVKVIGL